MGLADNVYGQKITEEKSVYANSTSESMENQRFQELLEAFLVEYSLQKNLPIASLRQVFDDVVVQTTARQYVAPPSGVKAKKNWLKYRQNTMHPTRISAGQKFWQEYPLYLSELEKKYQVPAEIIVGILGVETIYGKNMGNFPARDVLATLAFNYPEAPNKAAREILFRNQLASLINFCSLSESLDNPPNFKTCLKQPSSFAGAIGMPQFMPSSLLQFATDGNSDGIIDIRNSPEDAMASIANFLVQHGWVANQPILLPVENNSLALKNILDIADGDPNPKWTLSQLIEKHILKKLPTGLSPDTPALIVDLPIIESNNKESTSYWIGLKNFEVITQYNRSFFYAMSVTEFGYQVGTIVGNTLSNPAQASTLNSAIQEKLPLTNNDHHGHRRRIR